MLCRAGLRPILVNFISWKALILLGIIAVSLQTVNIGLSWWIQVISSRKSAVSKEDLSVHHQQQVSATYPEILSQIAQWSVLDSAGIFKFSLGILGGRTSSKNSDEYYNTDEARSVRQKTEDHGVTLVTQCSLSRLHLLPELAKRWQGPLSIAVFLLAEEVQAGVQLFLLLRKCFPEIQSNTTFSIVFPLGSLTSPYITPTPQSTPCNHLFSSLSHFPKSNYNFSGIPYPNNLLRNVARKAIKSSFMLVLDIDMLPSKHLYPNFLNYAHKNNLGVKKAHTDEEDKTVWVLPSYEVKEGVQVPEDKRALLQLKEEGGARPFYEKLCWKCQKHTDYEAWEKHNASSNSQPSTTLTHLYEVLWRDPWEPFYVSKTNIPSYDERFMQFGFNRISQVCELHVAGYRFLVLDSAFVVHKGFKKEGESQHGTKEEEQERNRVLFRQFKENLKEKYPQSSRRCY